MVPNRNMADTANSMAVCATKHGLLDRNEGTGPCISQMLGRKAYNCDAAFYAQAVRWR
jgi:hypothetical protein